MNKEQSHYGRDKIESAITEFKANILNYTTKVHINYEKLIKVIGTLINDEHIFYTVIEDIFTESMLEWQKTKNMCYQLRITKLTEIITSICRLIS